MSRTRSAQKRASAVRARAQAEMRLCDGAQKPEHMAAERHLAEIISSHAFFKALSQKYGLPPGKFKEVFNEASKIYSNLNVSAVRVKTLVYR